VCETCGCGIVEGVRIDGTLTDIGEDARARQEHAHPHEHPHSHDHEPPHEHAHPHEHVHEHSHDHAHPPEGHRTLDVRQAILEKNDRLAERNRGFFEARGLLVLNLLSSPGAGKTTLIERTAAALKGRLRLGVIVGDLATDNDARRIRGQDVPAVQITTGSVCHLDAEMVSRARERLPLDSLDVVIVENVGNLVCPASYDLGEDLKVVILSVTEGEDKPLKYPVIFKQADLILVSKVDLAEAAGFARETALENLRRIAPQSRILELSARTGRGIDAWCDALTTAARRKRQGSALAFSE